MEVLELKLIHNTLVLKAMLAPIFSVPTWFCKIEDCLNTMLYT